MRKAISLLLIVALLLGTLGSGCIGGTNEKTQTPSHSTTVRPTESSTVENSTQSPTSTTTTTTTTTSVTAPTTSSITSTTSESTTTTSALQTSVLIDFSQFPKTGEVIGEWRSIFAGKDGKITIYTVPEYVELVKAYFPDANVEDFSEYNWGIAVLPPEMGMQLLSGKALRIEKAPYFGYVAYRKGYRFVGADKGIITVFNSDKGARLIVTGTGRAGVGLALRTLAKINSYSDVPSFYVVRYGKFEGLVLKEIGDTNWNGVVEGDEVVKDYPLYYDEPFIFNWRVVRGLNVSVNGGFIRFANGSNVYIRALGFNVSISVSPIGEEKGVNLTFVVENINPDYVRYPDGAEVGETWIRVKSDHGFSITPLNVSNYTVIAFGDHRPARRNDPVPQVFVKIVKRVNNESAAFVIDNGDLVYSGRLEEWADLMRIWKWNKPIFVTPGNHEYQGEGKNIYHYLFGPDEDYIFTLGDHTYILMNNVENGYTLSKDQWEVLEKALKEVNKTGRRAVVVMHAPPYDPRPNGDHTMNRNAAQRLLNLMGQYNAFGIFSHIHMNWYGNYSGVEMIITGGAGAPLYVSNPSQGGFYGYAVLRMKPMGDIEVNFVRVD